MKKQLFTLSLLAFMFVACGGDSKMKDEAKKDMTTEVETPSVSNEEVMEMEKEAAAMEETSAAIENTTNELDSLVENL